MLGAILALTAILFGAAAVGGFTAVKTALAENMGLTVPDRVSPSNYDMAVVIWSLASVLLLSIIHPCFSIAAILAVRPWLDGYTFPAENVYFVWSIFLGCALWLGRTILRRERIFAPAPVLIFAGLLLTTLITTRFSYQYYTTYQLLWLWVSYGVLFLLTINALREAKCFGLVLTLFLAVMGLQALYSILHFEYLLPELRKSVQDPAILRQYFNLDAITPDLARRINRNRAFGTMLYPNCLAAYLLLGIPFVLFMVRPYWRSARQVLKRKTPRASNSTSPAERFLLIALSASMGVLVFVVVLVLGYFPKVIRDAPTPVYLETAPLTVIAFIAAFGAGLWAFYLVARFGSGGFLLLMRFVSAILLAPILLYALWLTYSRGAYLGFVASMIWGLFLFLLTPERLRRGLSACRRRCVSAALLICAASMLTAFFLFALVGGASSWAQAPSNAAASVSGMADARTAIDESGITLSMADMVDPESLKLRLGYWRVALRMFLDNPWTGVGLGNFATAYPVYQFIGAADVREAHNGYLQIFSETGFFGGLLFLGFWVYFAFWGARRIVFESDRNAKLLLLGIYTGVIAFCMHAVIEINFSNPSLMMSVIISASLFYVRAYSSPKETAPEDGERTTRRGGISHAAAAVVLLAFILAATGAGLRIYIQQLACNRFGFIGLSNNSELNLRMRVGRFFLYEVPYNAMDRARLDPKPDFLRIALPIARLLIDDMDLLAEFGAFYKPVPGEAHRYARLDPGESIPSDALMVVRKPWRSVQLAVQEMPRWLAELEALDRRFPHSPELAIHIAKWYEMLVETMNTANYLDARPEWIAKYIHWTEVCKQRNPYHADIRVLHAIALLWPVLHEEGWDNEELLKQSLAEWEQALALSPIWPGHRHTYAAMMTAVAERFNKQGMPERAAWFASEAEAKRREARTLEVQRAEAQIYQN